VLAFVNQDLRVKRRADLENAHLEIIWLEVFPFKSKRSLFISGIYHPPSYSSADDTCLEANIEQAYLLNKETVLLGDFNIDALNRSKFEKQDLCKGLKTMNFNQLIYVPTQPISGTCLDHIFPNQLKRIQSITCPVIGLSDHLPLFAVRKYNNAHERCIRNASKGSTNIRYRNMKRFDEEQFKLTLEHTPWDTVFVFDEIDNMLESWENLFNNTVDQHCLWRNKRVALVNQTPWMSNAIIDQLRLRDTLLKRSKHSNNPDNWAEYKKAKNKAVGMLKSAKRKYYVSKLENNKNNAKEIWKTIKSISGLSKQSKRVNNLEVGGCLLEDNEKIASEFNAHFTSIVDQLRSLLPQLNFDISKLQNFVISRKDTSITFSIPPITESKIIDCLKNISSNKASGIDSISARMLKLAAPIIAPSIAKLINYSFITSVFSQRWKTAKVTPLFKGGDPENVNNYRLISVLPVLSKVIKRHVHDSLYSYLCVNNLISSK